MTKAEIIAKMSEFAGVSKVESERNLESLLKVMEFAVENKEKFNLVGYFNMDVVETSERKGRNPKTKEEITIPAGLKVKMKCGKKLKDLL
jgi:DNA-binding protein HU-beta